jgi:hypothetical protein
MPTESKKPSIGEIIIRLLDGLTIEDWEAVKAEVDGYLKYHFTINSAEKKIANDAYSISETDEQKIKDIIKIKLQQLLNDPL